ncbi:MAG: DUF1338 family protein [Pseudomonadota bacterium]
MSNLEKLLTAHQGAAWTAHAFATIAVDAGLLHPVATGVTRHELAQALNMLLFSDLIARVPAAQDYVAGVRAAGRKVVFDHGALRTVLAPSGGLPEGEASITRVLRALGFRLHGTYPLERLRMTGRSWAHADFPEQIAQFFVSELHPGHFSDAFQRAVARVIGTSVDPLRPTDLALLEQLSRDGALPHAAALALLPALQRCFARQHAACSLQDYETLLAESPEMAWIATEGHVFNHATDRVADVEAVAAEQRRLGRPIKDVVEVSRSGRVRQTAFRAAEVLREFAGPAGQRISRRVPGSFYEFISRDPLPQDGRPAGLDLQFDAGNAAAIFGMTAAS